MNSLFFSNKIIQWYNINKRNLPWRETKSAYYVWVSEIILQQTRVDQGTAYYLRFIERFPDIGLLAKASEDDVLKMWQGLGYYTRARNLHKGAQQVITDMDGQFPTTFEQIKTIKGIGDYTASAISSIVFNLPTPAIDGNVFRVLSRVFGIFQAIDTAKGKRSFKELSLQLIDGNQPGDYNQAVMEFGALLCKPKSPLCETCPFQGNCYAFKNDKTEQLPVKSKKVKTKERFFNYLIIENKQHVYMNKRSDNDIWKNMFDFPLIETNKNINIDTLIQTDQWNQVFKKHEVIITQISNNFKHILTHQHINARFIHISIKNENFLPTHFIKMDKRDIFELAVPKIIENYLGSGFIFD